MERKKMWHRKIRVFSNAYRLSTEDSWNKGVTNYGLIESETLNGIKFSGLVKRAEKNALRLYVVISAPFPDLPIKLAILAFPEDWQKYHLFNWGFVAIRCPVIARNITPYITHIQTQWPAPYFVLVRPEFQISITRQATVTTFDVLLRHSQHMTV